MDTTKLIKDLQEVNGNMCLSLSIPTVKAGDIEKNRIRWKNAVSSLKSECEKLDKPFKEIADALNAYADNNDFWAHQELGLVGYFSDSVNEIVKLRHEAVSIADVGETFNLYPLISELQAHSSVYVLCVSKNKTSLHIAQGGILTEIDISDNVVRDYDEAMNFDEDTTSVQHHSVGGGDAIHHGNGATDEDDTVRTRQYLKRVDDGLMEIIQGQSIPLVLACVEEYLPLYKQVTAYKNLSDAIIAGNPDDLNDDKIMEDVNCIMTDLLGQTVKNFLDRFNETASRDLLFDKVSEFRSAIKMHNIDTVLINEARFSQMESEEVNKLTRDIVGAYHNGSKVICITDNESEYAVLGIRRFAMETSATV